MLRITVLLGNGFDISLGIKSSYRDFYKWYCAKPSDLPHIQRFRSAIKTELLSSIPDEERMWSDFELGLGTYTKYFTVDTVDQYIECFDDAQESIREYLLQQQELFDVSRFSDESIKAFRESIWSFDAEVSDLERITIKNVLDSKPGENREISFITYNYTNTLEQILKAIPSGTLSSWKYGPSTYGYILKRNVLHLHGTIDSFPILGLNDKSQIANKELFDTPQFEQILIKAESINALGKTWYIQAEEKILHSDIICVMGMSIGATDAKWWRQLIEWLRAGAKRQLVLYWYEKDQLNGISTVKQLRAVDRAKNKLLSYSDKIPPSEITTLKGRIHVVINTKKYLRLEKLTESEWIEQENEKRIVSQLKEEEKTLDVARQSHELNEQVRQYAETIS